MKNKKIISLICALAMIFSMFSAFTVVNAEVTQGIELVGTLSTDGKTLTIDATAKGMDAELLSFGIKFAAPEGVTDVAKTSYTAGATGGTWTPTLVNGIYTLSFFNMSPLAFSNGKLATITMDLGTPLASDYELKLENDAMIQDTTNGRLAVSTGMDNAAVTVSKWQDPNKKPDKVDRPDMATPAPAGDDPVPVPVGDKGIDLAATLNKENTVLTIDATAKGMDAELLSFGIKFAAPEGVTELAQTSYTAGATGGTWTPTLVNGIYTLSFFNMSPLAFSNGKLATIVIELPAAATKPIAVTLENDAMIQDTTNGRLAVSTGMAATSAVAKPSEEEPNVVKTVELKPYVGEGYAAAIAAVPEGKAVYLTVDVMKGDEKAVYGVDYVAEYPAGKVLTETEYKNLIHGYTDEDMTKVINELKFRLYNNTITRIKTSLNAEDQAEQLVMPPAKTDVTYGPTPATPTPKLLKLEAKLSAKEVNPKNAVKVNATVTSGEEVKVEAGDVIQFLIAKDDKYVEFNVDDDEVTEVQVDGKDYIEYTKTISSVKDDAATTSARVVALEKTGTTKIYVNFYKADDLTTAKASDTVTFKVTAAKGGNGGSGSGSDTTGKGGSIAVGNNGMTSANGTINFVDLDTVTWAQDAILRLVDKKVINGRSNTIFDPNGTVTRAEFAKMVVLGFGLTGGAPGNFSDVDASAWYNNYVQIGYANDVISGYDDGTFRPNGLISRQEMAAMISRAVKAANKNLPATVAAVDFTDVNPTTEWGYAEISALQTAGVINGMTATTFEPYSNATRAQAAVIIDRAMTNAR